VNTDDGSVNAFVDLHLIFGGGGGGVIEGVC
jgi:hypothetical protein